MHERKRNEIQRGVLTAITGGTGMKRGKRLGPKGC